MDHNSDILQKIKDGTLTGTVAQDDTTAYWCTVVLYNYNHNQAPLTSDNAKAGVLTGPTNVYMGQLHDKSMSIISWQPTKLQVNAKKEMQALVCISSIRPLWKRSSERKTYPKLSWGAVVDNVSLRLPGRSPGFGRRERRGQEHLDPDPGRCTET
jgi:hypothetical protein